MAHRKREDLLVKFEQIDEETNSTKTRKVNKDASIAERKKIGRCGEW